MILLFSKPQAFFTQSPEHKLQTAVVYLFNIR